MSLLWKGILIGLLFGVPVGVGSGCVGKMEDVPVIICGRDHESGGNIDVPVCLFLVWDCGRKRIGKRMVGSFGSADRDLSLVGRA